MRRRKKTIDNNTTSGAVFEESVYEAETNVIVALDDSLLPEYLIAPGWESGKLLSKTPTKPIENLAVPRPSPCSTPAPLTWLPASSTSSTSKYQRAIISTPPLNPPSIPISGHTRTTPSPSSLSSKPNLSLPSPSSVSLPSPSSVSLASPVSIPSPFQFSTPGPSTSRACSTALPSPLSMPQTPSPAPSQADDIDLDDPNDNSNQIRREKRPSQLILSQKYLKLKEERNKAISQYMKEKLQREEERERKREERHMERMEERRLKEQRKQQRHLESQEMYAQLLKLRKKQYD